MERLWVAACYSTHSAVTLPIQTKVLTQNKVMGCVWRMTVWLNTHTVYWHQKRFWNCAMQSKDDGKPRSMGSNMQSKQQNLTAVRRQARNLYHLRKSMNILDRLLDHHWQHVTQWLVQVTRRHRTPTSSAAASSASSFLPITSLPRNSILSRIMFLNVAPNEIMISAPLGKLSLLAQR